MTQEKRILLAFALSFLLIMAWRFLSPPPEPPPETQTVEAPATAEGEAGAPAPAPARALPSVTLPVRQGSQAEEITIENDLYRIVFSTQGAVVKSWVLKGYKDSREASGGWGAVWMQIQRFFKGDEESQEESLREPLDVVNAAACEGVGYPFSLFLESTELTQKVNEAVYVTSPGPNRREAPAKLTFEFSDGQVRVRKTFSFDSSYVVQVDTQVTDGRRNLPHEIHWYGGFGDRFARERDDARFAKVVYGRLAAEPKFTDQGDVEGEQRIPEPLQLAGLSDRYFAGIFLPGSTESSFRIRKRTWDPPDWTDEDKPEIVEMALARTDSQSEPLALFVGPKDLAVLRAVSPSLEAIVDYGWFGFIARPLFSMLRYTHDHVVSNYGWAIVLVTILINLGLFPLKLKGIRSSQAMQRVAPQVKAIQERYKGYKFNDPRKQRMNQEVMALYKQHGVNPFGGCLPMVFQIPFLFGFYKVLDLSIELRQAPFVGWIHDLSARDPLYILPVTMIVTMFLLQKMTPTPATDPAQQRMMKLMPLFFGIFFLTFAAGLVLYWLVGNLVGIGQQVFINRLAKIAEPVPAGKALPRKGRREASNR